ncbi:hypothetical protein ACH5RR_020373 [Cinchona calisaya]|uniref:Pantoate-beta-alanine ligase n=1 Tax=Cinchona calisaya TaxID=153742 RepID=A0ABD2ZE89_9GENT
MECPDINTVRSSCYSAGIVDKSLSEAKVAAEKGQINCRELRNSAIQAIQEASGVIDYAEVRYHAYHSHCTPRSLEAVEEIKRPVVFCVAAWFGKVRLIDNMEIGP